MNPPAMDRTISGRKTVRSLLKSRNWILELTGPMKNIFCFLVAIIDQDVKLKTTFFNLSPPLKKLLRTPLKRVRFSVSLVVPFSKCHKKKIRLVMGDRVTDP